VPSKRAAAGLDLQITKARKPEWLAENLDNPFRDWDGREHITAANARKAASLYKRTLSALTGLARRREAEELSAEAVREALETLVRGYTETFNKMDRRARFIETVEREKNYLVLVDLLQSINVSGGGADIGALVELFDCLRDY
jgi:DNA-binding LytR/AlgR family response regulator